MRLVLLNEELEIAGYLEEHHQRSFTTVVPRSFVTGRSALVLVSFGGVDLDVVGRLDKTRSVATYKDGVRCTDLTDIDPPVPLDELERTVPARVRRHLTYRTLPPNTGQEVLKALTRLRPYLADKIRILSEDPSDRQRRSPAYETVAMEKDAVGVAMDIFGADRAELTRWTPGDRARPFLEGLRDATLREDQIIAHDAGIFGEWEVVQRSAIASVQFKRRDRTLTVINVNRLGIESTLGIDLVYYNEHFDAFVLVQYKRLKNEGNAGWLYRPDSNHDREVERMREIPASAADPLDALNYRLNPGACFFKLCESTVFDPLATELLRGMYLPLDYLGAAESIARGSRGGLAYGYSTVPRHLNNTQFVDLVQDAWVGSAGAVTSELREFIEARVQDGRSVMLAIGTGPPPRGARR